MLTCRSCVNFCAQGDFSSARSRAALRLLGLLLKLSHAESTLTQPTVVDSRANLLCADRFWSRRDIALDLRVQRATDGENPTASTTERNSFVQRKDLSQQLSGLTVG
jgi:hypothetical protein